MESRFTPNPPDQPQPYEDVLVGGSGRTFAPQPVSLEGSVGLNVALGVSARKVGSAMTSAGSECASAGPVSIAYAVIRAVDAIY
jgi:Protein of unknown function (DUF992)